MLKTRVSIIRPNLNSSKSILIMQRLSRDWLQPTPITCRLRCCRQRTWTSSRCCGRIKCFSSETLSKETMMTIKWRLTWSRNQLLNFDCIMHGWKKYNLMYFNNRFVLVIWVNAWVSSPTGKTRQFCPVHKIKMFEILCTKWLILSTFYIQNGFSTPKLFCVHPRRCL